MERGGRAVAGSVKMEEEGEEKEEKEEHKERSEGGGERKLPRHSNL